MGTKRFLLFAGYSYGAQGGWDDFKASFDTDEEATAAATALHDDWYQIVDTTTGQVREGG